MVSQKGYFFVRLVLCRAGGQSESLDSMERYPGYCEAEKALISLMIANPTCNEGWVMISRGNSEEEDVAIMHYREYLGSPQRAPLRASPEILEAVESVLMANQL